MRWRSALIFTVLVASAGDPARALMRIYANVPFAQFPAALKANAAGHFLDEGFINVRSAPYGAKGDGQTDDWAAFTSAIKDAYQNNLVVYVPSGTYLVSQQLRLVQRPEGNTQSQRKFAHVLVGQQSRAGRPVLKLKDGATLSGPFIDFSYEAPDETGRSSRDPSRQYNATLRGLSIDMGRNPSATALSMAGAQYCVIEDVDISGTFDVGIRQLPGSGGSTTNLQIRGGRIGILQDQYRPNPLVTGAILIGQREAAVDLRVSRGPLTLVGFHIESPASAAANYRAIRLRNVDETDSAQANLNLVDGDIIVHGGRIAAIDNFDQDLYARNVYVRSDILITSGSRVAPADVLRGSAAAYRRIGEYAFAGGTDNSHLIVDGKEYAHRHEDVAKASDIADGDPPADLITRHVWRADAVPEFRDARVVNIVRDYHATPDDESDDDAAAIQQALDETTNPAHANFGKAVFIPRGHFQIRRPIRIPAGATLFGAANTISVIEISKLWQPIAPTAALITADADGTATLANFAILGHDPTPFQQLAAQKLISLLVVRTSQSLVRDVQFSAHEYWRMDNAYDAAAVVFDGRAGGHFYNVALDTPANHASGSMSAGYRLITVRGTSQPIAMYAPDVEHMGAGPQMEISGARNVRLYALKYEWDHELLRVDGSRNVGVFGGSGNYSLADPLESSIISVVESSDYVFANIARRPDRANPRDRVNAAQFAIISDGTTRVPANENNLTLFKSGEIR